MNEKHYFQIIYWKLFTKIIVKIIFLNRKITSFENFKKIKKTGNLTQLPQSTALHATQFPLIPQAASFSTVILKEFFAIVSIEHASSTVYVSMLQRRWRHRWNSFPETFCKTDRKHLSRRLFSKLRGFDSQFFSKQVSLGFLWILQNTFDQLLKNIFHTFKHSF